MANDILDKVYGAETVDEQRATYDAWARAYERDLMGMGYRVPWYGAAAFARYVPLECGPVLDAGCGGGLQAEPLAALGYGPITGIDLSDGMLDVARAKGIYAELHRMAMGDGLGFAPDSFGAALTTGAITPGHAPARSFRDLAEVVRPGGHVVFVLRSDPAAGPAYWDEVIDMAANGVWRGCHSGPEFPAMIYGEP